MAPFALQPTAQGAAALPQGLLGTPRSPGRGRGHQVHSQEDPALLVSAVFRGGGVARLHGGHASGPLSSPHPSRGHSMFAQNARRGRRASTGTWRAAEKEAAGWPWSPGPDGPRAASPRPVGIMCGPGACQQEATERAAGLSLPGTSPPASACPGRSPPARPCPGRSPPASPCCIQRSWGLRFIISLEGIDTTL